MRDNIAKFEAPQYIKDNLAKGLGRLSDEYIAIIRKTEKEDIMTRVEEITEVMLETYTEDEVREAVDEQMHEYIDNDWEEDGYESEYDWYVDHCNGEAESDILKQFILEHTKDFAIEMDVDEEIELEIALKEAWCL